MQYLRTNTATRITVGPFFDQTDGVTPETALTVTSEKLTFMVDDGGVPTLVLDTAPTASAGNNDMVHVSGDDAGYYDLELTAANVNYLGRARLALTNAAAHCPVFHEFMILPAVVYDALILGTDLMDVSVVQWTGTNVATPDTAGYPKVTNKVGTGTGELNLSSGAIPVTGDLTATMKTSVTTAATSATPTLSSAGVQAIWDAAVSNLTTVGSIGKRIVDYLTGDIYARLGAPAGASVSADVAAVKSDSGTLTTRLSSARAGYLDNLNVGGNVASSAEATAIQNNTRVVRVVPTDMERPDSGNQDYRIELYLYDEVGNMEAPDSAPTLSVVDESGNSRDGNLDSTTMSSVSTGRYRAIYNVESTDDLEQLIFTFSVVEGGATRLYGNTTLVVDTTAVDFTSSDRSKLDAVYNKLPSKTYLTGSANSDGDVQLDEATGVAAANVTQISGDSTAADNAESFFDGTGYAGTNNVIPTVTTLTNAPGDSSGVTTLLSRLSSARAGYLDNLNVGGLVATAAKLLKYFQLALRKDSAIATDNATELTALNADGGSGAGAFANTTDALEAIRDRGDAAWTTGGGGSITDLVDPIPLIPPSVDLANTATWRLGLMLINGLDDLPSTAEITPGTIDIDRKAIGGTSWTNVVSAQACSEAAGLVYYDVAFAAGSGYVEGDSLRITFKGQKITVSANDYEISDATGRMFYSEIRQTERGTNSAYTGTPPTVGQIRTEMDSNSTQLAKLGTPAGASMSADIAAVKSDSGTLTTRLSSARAGYLDNLNVGGLVAASAEVVVIQNNTRVVRVVPDVLERPDSGSVAYRIELLLYDSQGNMEAPDSAPTLSVVNQGGTSRDGNLDSTTMSLVSTGRYRSTYTMDSNHALEQLIFAFSVAEGGATRIYANPALAVDTSAVDFTSSDRTALNAIKAITDQFSFVSGDVVSTLNGETVALTDASLTAAKFATDSITAAALAASAIAEIQAGLSTYAGGDTPGTTTLLSRVGTPAGASLSADVAAVKAQTAAIEADTQDLQTRVPAALTSDGNMKSDALAMNGSIPAAAQLAKSAIGIVSGAAVSGTLSTTQMSTDLTETTNDHYKDLTIKWTSGPLAGQSASITAYNGATKTLTYSAVTDAPVAGNTFVLM